MIKAGRPKGCALNEANISPLKINAILWPKPHPGQKSQPKFANGHSET